MRKLASLLLFVLLALGMSVQAVQAEESLVKITSQRDDNAITLTITSIVDSVIIQKVTVNRGHCIAVSPRDFLEFETAVEPLIKGKITGKAEAEKFAEELKTRFAARLVPAKLDYGRTLKVFVGTCNLLEVQVETDQGGWTFNWN